MKKIIFLTLVMMMVWVGMASADACFIISKYDDYYCKTWAADLTCAVTYKNNEISAMLRNGVISQEDYDARTKAYDITGVYQAYQCSPAGANSQSVSVIVYGLDYEVARAFNEAVYEATGEVDVEGRAIMRMIADARYGIAATALPPQAKTLFDNNNYIEFEWLEICGYIKDGVSQLIGADCL